MILLALADAAVAATSNLMALNTPSPDVPGNIGTVIGGILASFAGTAALIYVGYRKVKSDKSSDTAGSIQQNVLAQVAALTESNQRVIAEERQYSASLKTRLDDEMSRSARRELDFTTERSLWAAERQRIQDEWAEDRKRRTEECERDRLSMSATLETANQRVQSLEAQVTRVTENARTLGDQLAAYRAGATP